MIMNKFSVSVILFILTVFGIIFYLAQKDNLFSMSMGQSPTPIQVPDLNQMGLPLLSVTPGNQHAQENNNGISSQQPQTAQPSFGVEQGVAQVSSATITTDKGIIKLKLFGDSAPGTVNNFAMKAKAGYYNNLIFHRVEDWVIQGGDPKGDGTGGGPIKTELNDVPFKKGSLGVARGNDINISNDSQFFIIKSDAEWLNGKYTNFGEVIEGLDIVDKMEIGDKILKIEVE